MCPVPEHGIGSALALQGLLDPSGGLWGSSSALSYFMEEHTGPRQAASHGHSPGNGNLSFPLFFTTSSLQYHCLIPGSTGPWSFVLIITVWKLFIKDIVTVHACDRARVPKVWAYQSHTTLHSWTYSEFTHFSRCAGIPPVGNLQHIEKGLACIRYSIKIY